MIFPTILYKLSGPHRGPNGTTYDFRSAQNEQESSLLIADGWHETLESAVNNIHSNTVDANDNYKPLPDRDSIEEIAKSLGIKFDGRTTNGKLIRLISEHGIEL